ncbi:hypothetical protein JKP88DRAFT_276422 [Tribonema minus]|uniref:CHRD domain-containing protein n=1 Tax=Tribonema minus TaxID=303371 RepID=A0A835Z309_9STRA|nr:hypothetical protein JKP88DRAFT_276422 [Tribonema minus]
MLEADLRGSNEVSDPAAAVNNGPDANDISSTAHITLDMMGQVCYDITVTGDLSESNGVGPITRGHIHQGPQGVAGPIAVALFEPPAGPTFQSDGTVEFTGCVPDANGVSGAIAAAPDQFYVNVHSTRYPGGSTASMGDDGALAFVTNLSGSSEVADPASPDLPVNNGDNAFDINGSARITVDFKGKICYDIMLTGDFTSKGVGAITDGHIHKAPEGQSGPVVVELFSPPTLPSTAPDGTLTFSGCAEDKDDVSTELAADTRSYYVNVHSKEYPGGAARGQLFAAN